MNIYEKLAKIQAELKAPKNQYNSFGGYNYRSCEDILESVKPLAHKYNAVVMVSDELCVKGDRCYVAAHAMLIDTEGEGQITSTAFAREPDTKKGMDSSQITGASSSYARKYALNGLFAIDDTKDKDTPESAKEAAAKEAEALKAEEAARQKAIEEYRITAKNAGFSDKEQLFLVKKSFKGDKKPDEMTISQANKLTAKIINDSAGTRKYIDENINKEVS